MSQSDPSSRVTAYREALKRSRHMVTTIENMVRTLEIDADPAVPGLQSLRHWGDLLVSNAHEVRSAIAGMERAHRLREMGQL